MRRVERGNVTHLFGKIGAGEVDDDARQRDRALQRGAQQRLLEPVGLRLHAVDEHADALGPIDAAALEHMPRRLIAFAGISGRE